MTYDIRKLCADVSSQISQLLNGVLVLTREDAQNLLNSILASAYKQICPTYSYQFAFEDINSFRPRMHPELCLVELSGTKCTLRFPESWLDLARCNLLVALAKRTIPLIVMLADIPLFELQKTRKFLFEVGDNGYLPAVTFCSKNNYSCLIADWDFISSGGYAGIVSDFSSGLMAWDERESLVFWRGGTTGHRRFAPPPDGAADNFQWLQRLWLCKASTGSMHRDICDIGVSNLTQIEERYLLERIKLAGLWRDPVSKSDYVKYKGIIDIDGNSNAWSGLFTALLSGACVLKVGSEKGFRQWYYSKLRPFSNYVPIAADFCDFDDAISWFRNNENAAREIGEAGRSLAQELTLENCIKESALGLRSWLLSSADVFTS